MWWNKKKKEKPELTEEQNGKMKELNDNKYKIWEKIIEAVDSDSVETAHKWLELYEKTKDYRWNFKVGE